MLGIAASIGEISGDLPDHDLNQVAISAVLGIGQAMMSKTWLQGPAQFFDALSEPGPKGRKMIEGLVGSALPGIVAAVERQVDPALRKMQSLIGQMR
jgi:hypothetical protein